jgi:hypothetical protein
MFYRLYELMVVNDVFESQWFEGPNSLKCTKILLHCHLFLYFLPSPFLPYKDSFMDDYVIIIKYNPSKFLENF